MQTRAVLRYARISPQKCRLVVDTIRGKSATLAVNTLKFMPKKGAKIVLKVLDSAIANAYNNFNADVDELKVTRIEVDPAPMLSRFHARAVLSKKTADGSVSNIHIERAAKRANITIHTARPGIVIGKKGEDIEKLRTAVAKILGMGMNDVRLNIAEIRKPELDAKLVAEGISQQLEKRVMFRRAMKRAVTNTMRSGALGIKVRISGRLNGSEIARTETNREGRGPLHTFRADIDYGLAEAQTTYGVIGIKVWIFKGEVFDKPAEETVEAEAEAVATAAVAKSTEPAAPAAT